MLPESYNKRQLEIAIRLRKTTGYVLMQPEEEVEKDDCGGNTVHYFSEQFSKPALTIETIEEDATFPLDHDFRFITFEELKLAIFEFGSLIL
jgi:g-D-glutamyl-meso-diaminopimelate peptidase